MLKLRKKEMSVYKANIKRKYKEIRDREAIKTYDEKTAQPL